MLAPGSTALGDVAGAADTVIDATGKYVIPGGIDGHTHMEMPFGGTFASDTFETGTRAAAWGGTTTIVDFVVQAHGQRVQDQLALWHEKAAGNCAVDYAFHQIIGDVDDDSLKAMDELIDEGITSFKLFMAYPGVFLSDDGQIVRAMQTAAGNGGLIMMHAENGSAIDVLVQQALARGETAPYYHGVTRPWQTEQEATHRAVMLADMTGAPLYVVHVSAKQALARIAEARNAGQNVFGETCPQYLYLSLEEQPRRAPGLRGREVGLLDAAALAGRGPPGRAVALHPHRRRHDRVHRPLPVLHEGPEGHGHRQLRQDSQRHRLGRAPDGPALPGRGRRPDLARALGRRLLHDARPGCSACTGSKGVIAPGADADIVVYDPAGHTCIGIGEGRTHHMNMDYSAWEGYEIDGHVDVVHLPRHRSSRTTPATSARKSHGRFVKRGLSQNLI